MARKKQPPKQSPQPTEPKLTLKDAALLDRAKRRREEGYEAVQHDFLNCTDDLKFCNNEGHWNEQVVAKRQKAGRPTLVFNHAVPYIRDIMGEQKESRPYTVVKPAGSGATQEVATIITDYLRARKHECKADDAYDTGFGQQLRGGFGNIQIKTKYKIGETFDQTFEIIPLLNQNSVIFDNNAELWHKNDGDWMMILSSMDKDALEAKYGGPIVDFESRDLTWYPSKTQALIAEYFEKEYYNAPLFQLSTGEIIKEKDFPEGVDKAVGSEWPNPKFDPQTSEPEDQTIKVIKKRMVKDYTIYRYLLCGHRVLEKKTRWPSKYWRIVPIDGDVIVINGKIDRRSLIRFSKDPNKAYNMSRCTEIESYTLVPAAPVSGTPAMFDGHEEQWDDKENTYSRLLYNPDPMMPGVRPERITGIDGTFIGALAQSSMQAKEEIRQTIGPNILLPRGANAMPNVSGQALSRWQKEGDVASYIFVDNLQKAIEWSDNVCVDLIQNIIDTEQVITCRANDGSTYDVKVNERVRDSATGMEITKNDLTKGVYEAQSSLGPSYEQQRSEIGDKMLLFVQTIPAIATATADLLASMLFDVSGAGVQGAGSGILEEFIKRVKRFNLKQGVISPMDIKKEELKDYLPTILEMQKTQPMPPELMAKLKTEAAKEFELMSKAVKNLVDAGKVKAETGQQVLQQMMQLFVLLGQAAVAPQPGEENTGQSSQVM